MKPNKLIFKIVNLVMPETIDSKQNTQIYRFKFTDNFAGNLLQFSKLHQFDDRKTFKEAWELWIDENNQMINDECRYLSNNGYKGDILEKMYKSSRYYFRKKPTSKTKPKKRRLYVSMDRDFLDSMDNHIQSNIHKDDYCPASGYDMFCLDSKDIIQEEVKRLLEEGLDGDEIKVKLKKTYKNRYFQLTH